jgi:hypothetical protein
MGDERLCLNGNPWAFLVAHAVEPLAQYFDLTGGLSGEQSELFVGGGDGPECRDCFIPADLL